MAGLVGVALVLVVAGCADGGDDETMTIMPIGDSNTERMGASTYRCYLDEMLDEVGASFDFVGSLTQPASAYTCPAEFDRDHEGVNGATIETRGAAIESVELLEPDVALVEFGADNIFYGQPVDEIAGALAAFIEDLQAVSPDTTVLVAQALPCRAHGPRCGEDVPAFNAAIASFERLSTDRSAVIVVDMHSGFRLDHLRGWHPTDEGDMEMARRWMAAMIDGGVIEA